MGMDECHPHHMLGWQEGFSRMALFHWLHRGIDHTAIQFTLAHQQLVKRCSNFFAYPFPFQWSGN